MKKKKQETNAAHSLHGQVPAERCLKRDCFLRSVQPADFPARYRPTRGGTDRQSPANGDHLLSWQSVVHLIGFSAPGQFAAAELLLLITTKLLRRRPDRTLLLLLQMSGDVHPNPSPATKYPCTVCARNVTSRGVSYQYNICSGCVHAKCSGLLNVSEK